MSVTARLSPGGLLRAFVDLDLQVDDEGKVVSARDLKKAIAFVAGGALVGVVAAHFFFGDIAGSPTIAEDLGGAIGWVVGKTAHGLSRPLCGDGAAVA